MFYLNIMAAISCVYISVCQFVAGDFPPGIALIGSALAFLGHVKAPSR